LNLLPAHVKLELEKKWSNEELGRENSDNSNGSDKLMNDAEDEDSTEPIFSRRWNDILKALKRSQNLSKTKKSSDKSHIKQLMEIIITFTWPRLDINVTKRMDHLLKCPFAIHPSTGRVCIPLDPSTVDEFNPESVPTMESLQTEADGQKGESNLVPFVKFFKENLLKPLGTEYNREKRKMNSNASELF